MGAAGPNDRNRGRCNRRCRLTPPSRRRHSHHEPSRVEASKALVRGRVYARLLMAERSSRPATGPAHRCSVARKGRHPATGWPGPLPVDAVICAGTAGGGGPLDVINVSSAEGNSAALSQDVTSARRSEGRAQQVTMQVECPVGANAPRIVGVDDDLSVESDATVVIHRDEAGSHLRSKWELVRVHDTVAQAESVATVAYLVTSLSSWMP